ncbi:MAG: hypothetical protein JWN99_2647 [Ilumatobacteraceae bacterium]|nr:hypothetical protein [Ilumatobacteraceae bacterium]
MTIRAAITKLLGRDGPSGEPDSPVEIAVVPIGIGPMTVESLRDRGFDAVGFEAYNLISGVSSDYRIMVPGSQSTAASAQLTDLL